MSLKLDYGNGDVEVADFILRVLPSTPLEDEILTLNSPIGMTIFGKEIGFIEECRINPRLSEDWSIHF